MTEKNDDEKKPISKEFLAEDLKTGWDSSERLQERLKSYAILKNRTKDFQNWANSGGADIREKPQKKIFKALDDCGQYLIFRNYQLSKKTRLIGACTCKQHLLCAFCASRRGVKHSMAYKEKFTELQNNAEQGSDLLFITFTVKNGENLHERFTHLRSSMRSLLKKRSNQSLTHTKLKTEMFKLTSGVFSYEFKRGSGSGDWHPHIHMLAQIPKISKIDIAQLKLEWLELTGDSSVINIKYADDNAYLEVFAYALKFSEMSHSDRWFAFNELKGERLISSFGEVRGVEITDSAEDSLIDSDEAFLDVLYKWQKERGYIHHKDL